MKIGSKVVFTGLGWDGNYPEAYTEVCEIVGESPQFTGVWALKGYEKNLKGKPQFFKKSIIEVNNKIKSPEQFLKDRCIKLVNKDRIPAYLQRYAELKLREEYSNQGNTIADYNITSEDRWKVLNVDVETKNKPIL